MTKHFLVPMFLLILLMSGTLVAGTQGAGPSKIVFYVACYDVGRSALEGLKGVDRVASGFHGFREINTVYYDPGVITPEEMKQALQAAGTYRGTLEEK